MKDHLVQSDTLLLTHGVRVVYDDIRGQSSGRGISPTVFVGGLKGRVKVHAEVRSLKSLRGMARV